MLILLNTVEPRYNDPRYNDMKSRYNDEYSMSLQKLQ